MCCVCRLPIIVHVICHACSEVAEQLVYCLHEFLVIGLLVKTCLIMDKYDTELSSSVVDYLYF